MTIFYFKSVSSTFTNTVVSGSVYKLKAGLEKMADLKMRSVSLFWFEIIVRSLVLSPKPAWMLGISNAYVVFL